MKLHVSILIALLAVGAGSTLAQERSEAELAKIRAELEQTRENLRRENAHLAELTRQLAQEAIKQQGWEQLVKPRPRLGVVLSSGDGPGVGIAAVTPGSPAEKAGLRAGDRLLELDGKRLDGADAAQRQRRLSEILAGLEPGQKVRLAFEREGRRSEADASLESTRHSPFDEAAQARFAAEFARFRAIAPPAMEGLDELAGFSPFTIWCLDGDDCGSSPQLDGLRWRGLRLITLEPKLGRYFGSDSGVLVLADRQGLLSGVEPGDVILSVNGLQTSRQQDLLRLLSQAEPGTSLDIDLLRDRARRSTRASAPERSSTSDLLRLLTPPVPPAPPAPPAPPVQPAPPAPPAPASVPAPPAPPAPGSAFRQLIY